MNLRKLIAVGASALALGLTAAPALAAHTYAGITYDAREPYRGPTGDLYGPASFNGTATKNLTVDIWFTQYTNGSWVAKPGWTRQFTILRGQSLNTVSTIYKSCSVASSRSFRVEVLIWNSVWDRSGSATLC